eukprot:TRINITY_DN33376_c0_g1_i1.p1 TRINITY_DN33376_c0_g1~~TRINITY_DN33376_c0_g1_i1.p1  ORF type:complete len:464 (+),score=74.44 TRINITY_DN33376_c0_g1_i1:77-1393(+)
MVAQSKKTSLGKKWVEVKKNARQPSEPPADEAEQDASCVYNRDVLLKARESCLQADATKNRTSSAASTDVAESTGSPRTPCNDDSALRESLPRTCDEDRSITLKPRRRRNSSRSGRTVAANATGDSECQSTHVAVKDEGHRARQRAVSWSDNEAMTQAYMPYLFPNPLCSPWPPTSGLPEPKVGKVGRSELRADAPEFMPEQKETTESAEASRGDIAVAKAALAALESHVASEKGVTVQMLAIRTQAEYYFSVANIGHDVFLRSLMDGKGWVRIERLMQFPKLRQMNVKIEDVVLALHWSAYLAVSGDNQRVRIRNRNLRKSFTPAYFCGSPETFARTYNPDVAHDMALQMEQKAKDADTSLVAAAIVPSVSTHQKRSAFVTKKGTRSFLASGRKRTSSSSVFVVRKQENYNKRKVSRTRRAAHTKKILTPRLRKKSQ